MNKNIKLYIADKLIDCSDELSLPITYQLESFDNPTIVKNSFSKTISIPGTKNNNKIFGEIYKLDRMQHYDEWYSNLSGIDFDPSKRVDFKIYKDADLVESGYMQLNNISINEGNVQYDITLYGGIGDFFYGLKYNEDGTSKTLADIRYFIEDEDGNVLDEDKEMDFQINKELVYQSFIKDYSVEGNQLTDTIAFIPAYNGEYEDFSTSKCLINTNNCNLFPTQRTVDGVNYHTYNGYALADLNADYTEWEMKDLRSYHQRPAIKVNKLIKAICREENSGYKVTFDSTFFNEDNPYWSKTFVALPLLTSNEYEESTEDLSSVQVFDYDTFWFGKKNTTKFTTDGVIKMSGTDVSTDASGNVIVTGAAGSTLNLDVKFSINSHPVGATEDVLYLDYHPRGDRLSYPSYQFYVAYLSVVDVTSGDELGYSSALQFQARQIISNGSPLYFTPSNGTSVTGVSGKFIKKPLNYQFQSNDGATEFTLRLRDCLLTNNVRVYLHITAINYIFPNPEGLPQVFKLAANSNDSDGYEYWADIAPTNMSGSITYPSDVSSGKTFTKQTFLKTEKTPADFLLDYTKLFGLYYIKDVYEKSIFICTRNTFFTGQVKDWTDRIDYLKNVSITPILFDKKFYQMKLDTPETKYAKRYNSQYSQEYGQQRLSTGYNFNYDTTNFYSENGYQQIIPAIHSDRFFRTFYNSANHQVPAWLNDNATYNLYNGTESTSLDLYGANYINTGNTVEWNKAGADIWAKSAFFDENNLVEIESALLMWNGLRCTLDSAGNPIDFWITDDVSEMNTLNDKEPCFIFTESEYNTNGDKIAIKTNCLPQYINCIVDTGNNVTASLDFGLPKEVYMGNVAYDENVTVYANFWKAFYNDQFNINTKKVTCFVKLDEMNQSYLRNFYFFDNRIWVLNKVDSYDITNDSTVRCEFIAVWDTSNYTNGQIMY